MLGFDGSLGEIQAEDISERLMAGNDRVFVAAKSNNTLCLGTENLPDGHVELVVRRLREEIELAAISN